MSELSWKLISFIPHSWRARCHCWGLWNRNGLCLSLNLCVLSTAYRSSQPQNQGVWCLCHNLFQARVTIPGSSVPEKPNRILKTETQGTDKKKKKDRKPTLVRSLFLLWRSFPLDFWTTRVYREPGACLFFPFFLENLLKEDEFIVYFMWMGVLSTCKTALHPSESGATDGCELPWVPGFELCSLPA